MNNIIAKQADVYNGNTGGENATYQATIVTSPGPVGKRYTDDLSSSAFTHLLTGSGTVEQYSVVELYARLKAATPNDVMIVGAPIDGSTEFTITTKEAQDKDFTALARSNDNFTFPDKPGFIVIDHDPGHWNGTLETEQQIEDMVAKGLELDSLSDFDFVTKTSSSSYIYQDGRQIKGLQGMHIYIGVTSLAALNNGGAKTLMDLLFANDCGNLVVSSSGAALKRGVFDIAPLSSGNNLIFIGAPTFEGEQQSRPSIKYNQGRPLDLAYLIHNAKKASTVRKSNEAWSALLAKNAPLVRREKTLCKQRLIAKHVDLDPDQILQIIDRQELPGDFTLQFDDGRGNSSQANVWEVISNPGEYDGRTDVLDPLEPDYGFGKCKLFIDGGRMTLNSFAHGGRVFKCFLEPCTLEKVLSHGRYTASEAISLSSTYCSSDSTSEIASIIKDQTRDKPTTVVVKEKLKYERYKKAKAALAQQNWGDNYAYISSADAFVDLDFHRHYNKLPFLSEKAFNNTLANQYFPKKPTAWLLENNSIQSYVECRSIPALHANEPPPTQPGILNMWRQGPILSRSEVKPELWLFLMNHLFGNEAKNVIDWLAWNLQNPGIKGNWQMLWFSIREGVGKDTVLSPVRFAMGGHNCTDVSPQQLESQFNEYLLNGTCLVVLQELDIGDKQKVANDLKVLCADTSAPTISVNVKNKTIIEAANTFGLISLTNNRNPIYINKNDRRHHMIEVNSRRISDSDWPGGEKGFFTAIRQYYASGGLQVIGDFLYSRDISGFDPHNLPPATEYKETAISMSMTNYEMVIDHVLNMRCFKDLQVITIQHIKKFAPELNLKNIGSGLFKLDWERTRVRDGKSTMWVYMSPKCTAKGSELLSLLHQANLACNSADEAPYC